MREAKGRHGGVVTVELTETFLVEPIPDVDITIGSTCGKCIVDRMEAYCIDWVDFF